MPTKLMNTDSRIKLREELPQGLRSGGTSRPLEYPHLYQIHAGDWRISYAVENNRLAILVLEVLSPEGQVLKDVAHEKLTKKMKIKLLDLPEQGKDMSPDEVGKRLKIKLLDMTDDTMDEEDAPEAEEEKLKIKFINSEADAATNEKKSTPVAKKSKVTPLDSPSQ